MWGVSANTRNWWDLTAARALGYEPADDAEVYAEALIEVHGEPDLADPVHGRVGGEYTTADFDAENFEPPAPRADSPAARSVSATAEHRPRVGRRRSARR